VIDSPRVNDLVLVRVGESPVRLRSRVEDAAPGMLSIAYLSDGLTEHRVPLGTEVTLEWPVERGVGQVRGVVMAHADVGVQVLVVQLVSQPELVQRRRHVRADLVLELDICIDEEADEWVGGFTLDISGGGLRVLVPTPLPVDARVRVAVDLPTGGSIEAPARVVSQRDDGVVALEFDDIIPADRERLIRAVFASYQVSATVRRSVA
jgi:c-di-GMP-binding flagellar brake protein YcgR